MERDYSKNTFKLAILPSMWLGILTNLYISSVIFYAEEYVLVLSPFLGSVFFLVAYALLKRNIISAEKAYFFGAIVVAIEVVIHTYFFGWDAGFFYYLFLLPIVFLLNSAWKAWINVVFNSSLLTLLVVLSYFFWNQPDTFNLLSEDVESAVYYFNSCLTGVVIIVVMIYFSRTIGKNEKALVDANRFLEEGNKEIKKQHELQKVLLKEIHHRVKNNLQIISSLMSLQSQNVQDDRVVEVLGESRQRVEAIALIHQKLYQDDKGNLVDFKAYIEELSLSQKVMNPNIDCKMEAEELTLHLDVAVPLGLIFSELLTNTIKHAFKGIEHPMVHITLGTVEEGYELCVSDNGIGLPEDFDLSSGEQYGLGTDIIIALTDQIDGRISHYNKNGAHFCIRFKDTVLP